VIRLSLLVAAVALFAACENEGNGLPLVGTLERDRIEITADSWEVLTEVLVKEGESVAAGQVLARQDPERATIEMQRARAAEDQAARRLAELIRGPREEEIDEARARLAGAESDLAVQEREFVRVRDLVAKALLSDSDLDRASGRRDLARADRDQARSRLEAMLEGTTIEELDQARANLSAAQAVMKDRQLSLDRLQIRATRDGWVDALPFKQGDRPRSGDVVVVVLADSEPFARVYIPEQLRVHIAPGTTARIAVDGLTETFQGRVKSVSRDPAFTPYFSLTERDRSRLSYLAEVTLTGDTAMTLPAGVPLEVDFPGLSGLAAD
jgi:HlyD family secretion protein